ncbi:hypothetical protein V7S43_009520 [Phytophthora oleae]|uniref:Uncharacterized protein n=1 Tax=Phytophthora oleae TaxID=2107226 RepID=A0ABD3FIV0_9STRA
MKASTKPTYLSKINAMTACLSSRHPDTITATHLRSCSHDKKKAPRVPFSASCIIGYRSALVDAYRLKLPELDLQLDTELRHILEGNEKINRASLRTSDRSSNVPGLSNERFRRSHQSAPAVPADPCRLVHILGDVRTEKSPARTSVAKVALVIDAKAETKTYYKDGKDVIYNYHADSGRILSTGRATEKKFQSPQVVDEVHLVHQAVHELLGGLRVRIRAHVSVHSYNERAFVATFSRRLERTHGGLF